MGQRKHKGESQEKTNRANRTKETNPQVVHPLLQLQQTIGNNAVTNLIQRHQSQQGPISHLQKEVFLNTNSVIYAHNRIDTNKAAIAENKSVGEKNKSSIGVLFGKVNQLSQSSGGGSGDIYED